MAAGAPSVALAVLVTVTTACGSAQVTPGPPDGPPRGTLLVIETQPCNWLRPPDPNRCDWASLVRLGLDGEPIEELAPDPPMTTRPMAVSPDRSLVAWTWNWEVGVMGADGTGARVVTHKLLAENMGENAIYPVFSPDGNELLYQWAGANHDPRWYRVDLGSEALTEVDMPVDCHAMAWAPDGQRVACTVVSESADGEWLDLVLVHLETLEVTPLTDPDDGIGALAPDWSPDGRWLALAMWPETVEASPEAAGLWLLDVDTNERTRIVEGRISSPAWSPDGGYLAAYDEDAGRIIIVGRDGSGLTTLDHEPHRYIAPRWIPGE